MKYGTNKSLASAKTKFETYMQLIEPMSRKNDLEPKLDQSERLLKKMPAFAVAFSGGVDSTFLLAVARKINPEKLIAVTVASGFVPKKEVWFAREMAESLGVEHRVIDLDVLEDKRISANPPDRCYHCKKSVFSRILSVVKEKGIQTLLHAVNLDDLGDYRPGLAASKELGVLSPLVDAGFTKADIRQASRKMGLSTWDKPSQSCLATRIPYNIRITDTVLHRIEKAEEFLHDMGFGQVRVRVHDKTARIEVLPDEIGQVMEEKTRKTISGALKDIGFQYVSIDMDGYKTGKMNNEILAGKTGQDFCSPS